MVKRRERRAERARRPNPVSSRPGRSAYVVDLAVEARLFGRLRLLTLSAVVDVVEPRGGRPVLPAAARPRVADPSPRPVQPASASRRRLEAEALLGDAERTLSSANGR